MCYLGRGLPEPLLPLWESDRRVDDFRLAGSEVADVGHFSSLRRIPGRRLASSIFSCLGDGEEFGYLCCIRRAGVISCLLCHL